MSSSHYFCIAGHNIRISFNDDDSQNNMGLLPSFQPFAIKDEPENSTYLLTIDVDDSLRPAKDKKLVRKFVMENTLLHGKLIRMSTKSIIGWIVITKMVYYMGN